MSVKLPLPTVDAQRAYEFGRDAALNGCNTTNCHFTIFSSRENADAWERGRREAGQERLN